MMADYFGKILIEPQTLEHQSGHFKAAFALVRQSLKQNDISDVIVTVTVERTGNFHLPLKNAFSGAVFETRVVHPFATAQYRMLANPGNKTDETDLHAQHRAAVAGFSLCERELPAMYCELQLQVRHRPYLVEKASSLAYQVRDHLHLSMPGYPTLFDHLLDHRIARGIVRCCEPSAKVAKLGQAGIRKRLRNQGIRYNQRTIDKVFVWPSQEKDHPVKNGGIHHMIWTDLEELYRHFNRQITAVERVLTGFLAQTPWSAPQKLIQVV